MIHVKKDHDRRHKMNKNIRLHSLFILLFSGVLLLSQEAVGSDDGWFAFGSNRTQNGDDPRRDKGMTASSPSAIPQRGAAASPETKEEFDAQVAQVGDELSSTSGPCLTSLEKKGPSKGELRRILAGVFAYEVRKYVQGGEEGHEEDKDDGSALTVHRGSEAGEENENFDILRASAVTDFRNRSSKQGHDEDFSDGTVPLISFLFNWRLTYFRVPLLPVDEKTKLIQTVGILHRTQPDIQLLPTKKADKFRPDEVWREMWGSPKAPAWMQQYPGGWEKWCAKLHRDRRSKITNLNRTYKHPLHKDPRKTTQFFTEVAYREKGRQLDRTSGTHNAVLYSFLYDLQVKIVVLERQVKNTRELVRTCQAILIEFEEYKKKCSTVDTVGFWEHLKSHASGASWANWYYADFRPGEMDVVPVSPEDIYFNWYKHLPPRLQLYLLKLLEEGNIDFYVGSKDYGFLGELIKTKFPKEGATEGKVDFSLTEQEAKIARKLIEGLLQEYTPGSIPLPTWGKKRKWLAKTKDVPEPNEEEVEESDYHEAGEEYKYREGDQFNWKGRVNVLTRLPSSNPEWHIYIESLYFLPIWHSKVREIHKELQGVDVERGTYARKQVLCADVVRTDESIIFVNKKWEDYESVLSGDNLGYLVAAARNSNTEKSVNFSGQERKRLRTKLNEAEEKHAVLLRDYQSLLVLFAKQYERFLRQGIIKYFEKETVEIKTVPNSEN